MKFRLSNERQWASDPFEATTTRALMEGIRQAWQQCLEEAGTSDDRDSFDEQIAWLDNWLDDKLAGDEDRDHVIEGWRDRVAADKRRARKEYGLERGRLQIQVELGGGAGTWYGLSPSGSPRVKREEPWSRCVKMMRQARESARVMGRPDDEADSAA